MGGSCETASPPSLGVNNVTGNMPVNSSLSDIVQFDGNDDTENLDISDDNLSDAENSDTTEYDTDDEVEPNREPIAITPAKKPDKRTLKVLQASSLPLVSVLNARSIYNKPDSFKTLHELGIEAAIVSESWEREDQPLENLLQLDDYKVHSYKRPKVKANRQPGGGCAIVYNEHRFKATKLDVHVPNGVEACWLVLKQEN